MNNRRAIYYKHINRYKNLMYYLESFGFRLAGGAAVLLHPEWYKYHGLESFFGFKLLPRRFKDLDFFVSSSINGHYDCERIMNDGHTYLTEGLGFIRTRMTSTEQEEGYPQVWTYQRLKDDLSTLDNEKIQLVKYKNKSIDQIIKEFDFTVCQAYLQEGLLHYTEECERDHKDMVLRISPFYNEEPLHGPTMFRIQRYYEKGYKIDYAFIFDLLSRYKEGGTEYELWLEARNQWLVLIDDKKERKKVETFLEMLKL